ncbi:MAG: F0F1 ATP synthase subunit epsilon [Micrococcaceae bacterium]
MAEDTNKKTLKVDVVSVSHRIWHGLATMVIARTVGGDVGIMPGHAPILGLMEEGKLVIKTLHEGEIVAETRGGFLSVDDDKVAVIANDVRISSDHDIEDTY